MSSSFFKSIYTFFLILIFLILFISCFFGPSISQSTSGNTNGTYYSFNLNDEYIWPIPGYTTITSPFGYRNAPTTGATSYHSGIDIGAPQGTKLVAVCSGKITFTGFLGGGGYTITLSVNNIKITYCHVSPNYIVKVGDTVEKGDVIGHVGPKNVYGVLGNQYYDENGNPTNGATTGPHLHLGVRIDEKYVNPLTLFKE